MLKYFKYFVFNLKNKSVWCVVMVQQTVADINNLDKPLRDGARSVCSTHREQETWGEYLKSLWKWWTWIEDVFPNIQAFWTALITLLTTSWTVEGVFSSVNWIKTANRSAVLPPVCGQTERERERERDSSHLSDDWWDAFSCCSVQLFDLQINELIFFPCLFIFRFNYFTKQHNV